MGQAIFWTNVGVDVQTALSAPVVVSGITKATPGVVTYTGATVPAVGDYIVFTANGMMQVNDRIFRVANVNAAGKTFELEGEDTTLYDNFTSGSFQVITFGASFQTVQTVNVSGGDYDKIDTTTIHDQNKKNALGAAQPMSISMTNLFDLTDPGFLECNKAYKSKSKRALRLRFGTGPRVCFVGYVGAAGIPTGQAQGAVQTPVSVEAQNLPTVFPS